MPSRIVDIYRAIGNIPVSAAGKTPTVRHLDQLPRSVSTAQLPIRLMLPFGNFNTLLSRQADVSHVTISGAVNRVNWFVRDLCLWRPLAQGIGLEDSADQIMEYAGNYLAAITEHRRSLSNAGQSFIDGAAISPGIHEYPLESGNWYFGIDCTVNVIEILT